MLGIVDLAQPGDPTLGSAGAQAAYAVAAAPRPGFDGDPVSERRLTGRTDAGREEDAGPVPVGAIVLWPNAERSVPLGWAVCDGSHATPDLSAQFPAGLKYIRKLG